MRWGGGGASGISKSDLHGRLGRNLQVVSRAVVVAIGIVPSATTRCWALPWVTARRAPLISRSSAWGERRRLAARGQAVVELLLALAFLALAGLLTLLFGAGGVGLGGV